VLRAIQDARVLAGFEGAVLVATATLTTRKPWAIDRAYFTPARRPLYLINMAVAPERQGQGIGRALLAECVRVAREWPGDAIWLDAYDAPAGAGGFYARCGFREVGRASYRGTPLIYFELRL
jgi:GNAT superfamily N-acetyltransferase